MTEGNQGYGQLDPNDGSSQYNVIQFQIDQTLARIRTMTPVKVIATTADGSVAAPGTVNVQSLVNMVDGQGNATPHGTIFNIPIFRLQGGTGAVILDPVVDDIGWMAVADRDISSVKVNKAVSNPGSQRKFDLADGVYMGAILGAAPTQYVRFHSGGVDLVDKNGNKIAMKAGAIAITGNLTVTGEVTAGFGTGDSVTLQLHQHTANNTPPTPGT